MGKSMISGALPYGAGKGNRTNFKITKMHIITIRLSNMNTKCFVKSVDTNNNITITGDKKHAAIFSGDSPYKLCKALREKYDECIIGIMPI